MKKLLLLLLLASTPCWASFTFVEGQTATSASAAATVSMGTVTAGNILVAFSLTAATSGSPTVSMGDSGTSCSWNSVSGSSVVAGAVIYAVQYCLLTTTGIIGVSANWTGGSGTRTDISVAEYSSTAGWRSPAFWTATATQNGVAGTTCSTGNTTSTIPPGNLLIAVCGTFNASQTWTGTVGTYTNHATASTTSVGWYDSGVTTLATQSFSTTIASDIYFGVIAVFSPSGAARGKAVVF
jgi:hypothetical protein